MKLASGITYEVCLQQGVMSLQEGATWEAYPPSFFCHFSTSVGEDFEA